MAGLGENFVCDARPIGDRHWCGRCSLSFGLSEKTKPACRAPADVARVLPTLRASATAQAAAIDVSIDIGFNCAKGLADTAAAAGTPVAPVEPSRDQLRQAAALRRLAWLAAACAADSTILERLRRACARCGAAPGQSCLDEPKCRPGGT